MSYSITRNSISWLPSWHGSSIYVQPDIEIPVRITVALRTSHNVLLSDTLRGDTVSMLTHIYTHKPLRKTEVTICNHQADSHFVCDLMSDLVICKF